MYEPRTYRHWIKGKDLLSFNIAAKETDLCIRASTNLRRKAYKVVSKYRDILERYIERHPTFLTSLEPVSVGDDAPNIVKLMAEATARVGIGPMASVAGAIAESVGIELSAFSPEIIVENGGDIYLKSLRDRLIGIYAGESPLTGKIGLEINGEDTPLGICTSSGTVGHSLSYGKADAVIVVSKSAIVADAAATAIGNLIVQSNDIPSGIEFAQGINGLLGVIIIRDDNIGLWGEVKICQLSV
ncbi:MAG TPA: UPF0280 family protein [Dehalococcoidia bacterium]|nr:UPF0280 family protein [Dehalococcoidia bacterium]